MKIIYKIFYLIFTSFFLISCGGGTTSSSLTDDNITIDSSTTAYFIDSPVQGLTYKYYNASNQEISALTDSNGKVNYIPNTLIKFYIGNAYIGEIESDSIKMDKKIFIQDIVGVDRAKTFDENVIKIARVLQTLDYDNNPDNGITLTQTISQYVNIQDLSISQLASLMQDLNKTLVSEDIVQTHLNQVLKQETGLDPFLNTYIDTTPPQTPTITYPLLQYDAYISNGNMQYYFTNNLPVITVNGEIETQVVVNGIKTKRYIDVDNNISVTLNANGDDGYYEYNISLIDNSLNQSLPKTITLVKETLPPLTPVFTNVPSGLVNSDTLTVEIKTPLNSWEVDKGAQIWIKSDNFDWKYYKDLDKSGISTIIFDTSSILESQTINYYIKIIDNFVKKDIVNRTSGILSFSVTKDTIPPEAPIRLDTDPIITNNNSFDVTLISEKSSKIICNNKIVATTPSDCGDNRSECEVKASIEFPNVQDGSYDFDIYAQDLAGNLSKTALKITATKDSNIPNPPVLNSQDNDLVIYTNDIDKDNKEAVKISCSKAGCENEHYSVYIDSKDSGYDLDSNGELIYDFDLTSLDGNKTYEIKFVDSVNRSSATRKLILYKDTIRPSAPILEKPLPNNNTTTENNVTVLLKGDEANLEVLVAGVPQNIETNSTYETSLFLDLGTTDITNTFDIAFRDKANNISPTLTLKITRDTTPPDIPQVTLIDPSQSLYTSKDEAIFRISGEVGAYILVDNKKLDSNITISKDGYTDVTLDITGEDGSRTFRFALSDIVNNTSQYISQSVIKDTIAPDSPTIDNLALYSYTNQDSVSMYLNGEPNSEIFINGIDQNSKIQLDGKKIISLNTSGSDGIKSFSITLKDYAFNESKALEFNITKDTVPPQKLWFQNIDDVPTHTMGNSVDVSVQGDSVEYQDPVLINDIDSGQTLSIIGEATVTLNTSDIDNRPKEFDITIKDKAGNISTPLGVSIFKDDYYLMITSAILNLNDNNVTLYFTDDLLYDSLSSTNVNDDLNLTTSNLSNFGQITNQGYISSVTSMGMQGKLTFDTSGIIPYYEPNKDNITAWSQIFIDYYLSPEHRISSEIVGLDNIPPPYYASTGTFGQDDFVEYRGYQPINIELFMPVVTSGQVVSYENTPEVAGTYAPIDHNITYNRDDGACSTTDGKCNNIIVDKGCSKDESVDGEPTVKCTGTHLEWRDDNMTLVGTSAYNSDACSGTYANKSDWRIPTINELITISDKSKINPSLDSAFTDYDAKDTYFWSSTQYAPETPTKMWTYGIYKGNIYPYLQTDTDHVYIRCVRGIDLTIK